LNDYEQNKDEYHRRAKSKIDIVRKISKKVEYTFPKQMSQTNMVRTIKGWVFPPSKKK